MPDAKLAPAQNYLDPTTGIAVVSDSSQYESDCTLISILVQSHFLNLFEPDAPFALLPDGSPDLVACYYAVLADLESHGCPRSRWLGFSREKKNGKVSVGFLMFGMLVAVKMRGFLTMYHGGIVETDGWAGFENMREGVQRRILGDVRGEGWSWAMDGTELEG